MRGVAGILLAHIVLIFDSKMQDIEQCAAAGK